ncbi:MAG: hypothetical protein ACXABY_11260 [Candidatus Thorarchaeota archaeon]|jgi:hypothetical protein
MTDLKEKYRDWVWVQSSGHRYVGKDITSSYPPSPPRRVLNPVLVVNHQLQGNQLPDGSINVRQIPMLLPVDLLMTPEVDLHVICDAWFQLNKLPDDELKKYDAIITDTIDKMKAQNKPNKKRLIEPAPADVMSLLDAARKKGIRS